MKDSNPDTPKLVIREATTDFVDDHVAFCPKARCWLCDTYQQTQPDQYAAAINRGQGRRN